MVYFQYSNRRCNALLWVAAPFTMEKGDKRLESCEVVLVNGILQESKHDIPVSIHEQGVFHHVSGTFCYVEYVIVGCVLWIDGVVMTSTPLLNLPVASVAVTAFVAGNNAPMQCIVKVEDWEQSPIFGYAWLLHYSTCLWFLHPFWGCTLCNGLCKGIHREWGLNCLFGLGFHVVLYCMVEGSFQIFAKVERNLIWSHGCLLLSCCGTCLLLLVELPFLDEVRIDCFVAHLVWLQRVIQVIQSCLFDLFLLGSVSFFCACSSHDIFFVLAHSMGDPVFGFPALILLQCRNHNVSHC